MTEAPATPIEIPFQGLRYFDEDRVDLFFGRDDQIHELLEKFRQSRFVTVIGSSGSGKSSLVRAGLLPVLRSGLLRGVPPRWRVVKSVPGEMPIRALANAIQAVFGMPGVEVTLRRGPLGLVEAAAQSGLAETENLLVFVDQFEEIFRYERVAKDTAAAREEAAAFVKLLLEAAQTKSRSIYVLLTMRSDYMGNASNFRDLPERINRGLYLIPRMTRDQIEEAIRGPIAICGAQISSPLAQRLLNDLADSTDHLPVLQHAMLRTWLRWKSENRPDEPIDLRHYEQAGGLKHGLSNHANEVYGSLSLDQQAVCEALFRCLTERDPGDRDIRRPTGVAVAARVAGVHPDRVREVAELFRAKGTTFLMPPPEVALEDTTQLDITHESLIRNWDKLSGTAERKGWVRDEADLRDQYRDLAKRARRKTTAEDLLRGGDLAAAIEWRKRDCGPGWAERYDGETQTHALVTAYIAESEKRRVEEEEQAQLAVESARREHQKKRMRRIFWAVGGVIAMLLLGLVAKEAQLRGERAKLSERDRDVAVRIAAEQTERAGREKQLRDLAEAKQDEAVRERNIAGTRELIAHATETLPDDRGLSRILALHAVDRAVRYVPEALPAAENALHAAILVPDAKFTFRHGGAVRAVAFSGDGTTLATGSDDRTVKLWNTHSGKLLFTLRDKEMHEVLAVAFSIGNRVATASYDRRVRAWDTTTGKEIASHDRKTEVTASAFSPDGKFIATTGVDGSMELLNTSDPQNPHRLDCGAGNCLKLAFSPDGRHLAAGGIGQEVRFWDTSTLGERERFPSPWNRGATTSVAYSPDGRRLAIATNRSATLWDLQSGKYLEIPGDSLGGFTSVAFGPSGQSIATGSSDGTARMWDAQTGRQLGALAASQSAINSVALSPDGKLLATASNDGTAQLFDATSPQGRETRTLYGPGGAVHTLTFSPDDKLLAVAGNFVPLQIWDMNSGRQLRTSDSSRVVRFSPDGKLLAVGGTEAAVITDVSSGKTVRSSMFKNIFADLGGETLAFSPDLTRFVSRSHPTQPASLWDASGKSFMATELWRLSGVLAAFSPDGNWLVTGSPDGTVDLWDIASRRKLLTVHPNWSVPNAVGFSPDAKRFAIASDDGTAKLFDVRSGKEELILRGHRDRVLSLAFSPDGKRLATGSYDRTVRVWDAASGGELLTLRGQQSGVWSVAFSHDGERLAAASEDGTVQVYAVGITEIFNLVRSRIGRNLTSEECAKYLHTAACPPVPLSAGEKQDSQIGRH